MLAAIQSAYLPALIAAACFAVAMAATMTALVLVYARRRGLVDQPGQRRSHSEPTPRGGGLGIVVVALIGLAIIWPLTPPQMLWLLASVVAVGVVGWIDDHRGLGIVPRLAVQVLAAAVAVVAVAGMAAGLPFLLLAGLGVVAFTNVTNFMDGSNGMAALQGVFLGAAGTLIGLASGQPGWALWCLLIACACLGFLPFNVPRARIFLGDVGSTSLGFCLGLAAVALVAAGAMSFWQAILLASAFLADAGLTLAWRILRRRRWYTAHREHTYQWLIRSGFSHLEVAGFYMAWNLLLVSPLILLGLQRPTWQPALALIAYVSALALWLGARAWCLGRPMAGRA
jgi:UDP-N-acetylmuramyl pentapeptide phosphotransferase/UDP-N-acetylglucosamine-1-phosphate transferase